MDRQINSSRLRALASDDRKRSKVARLRDMMEDIELVLSSGVTRADLIAELKALGLDISLNTLASYLKRHRDSAKQAQHRGPDAGAHGQVPVTVPPAAVPVEPPSVQTDAAIPSYSPDVIDAIRGRAVDLVALSKLVKRRKP